MPIVSAPVKKRKKYDCEICGRTFLHYGRYEVHKTFHNNVKYHCGEYTCNLKTDSKDEIEKHQAETGHKEITVIENLENYVSTNRGNIRLRIHLLHFRYIKYVFLKIVFIQIVMLMCRGIFLPQTNVKINCNAEVACVTAYKSCS